MSEENKTEAQQDGQWFKRTQELEEMITALRADKDALAVSLNASNDVIASLHNDTAIAKERHDNVVKSLNSYQGALEESRDAVFSAAQVNARDIFRGLALNCLNDHDAVCLAGSLIDLLETLRRTDYSYLVEDKVSNYYLSLVKSCDEDACSRDVIIREWTESGFIKAQDAEELGTILSMIEEAKSSASEAQCSASSAEDGLGEAESLLEDLISKLE